MTLLRASNFALEVDHLTLFLVISCSIVVLVVWGAIITFCFRYHKDSKADRTHPPEKSTFAEVSIMLFIFLFGITIFAGSARVFYQMRIVPDDVLEVDVTAKQWLWIFHDSKIGDQINILKIPVGRNIKLIMNSEDVIHSFFVPEFRVKEDVVPGRYTTLWFQANQIGNFEILCTQYCGLRHSEMRGTVQVVSQEDYEKTRLNPNAHSDFERGKNLYLLKGCVSCHDEHQKIGPTLTGIYGTQVKLSDDSNVLVDENYLRRSLLEPNAEVVKGYPQVMPTYKGILSEEEILALISFIRQAKP